MRFLVDAQLPPGLAVHLRKCGHDAIHIADVLASDATDAEVSAEAESTGAVIITKDQDFVDMARTGRLRRGVLWIRFGNVTNLVLWRKLEPFLPNIVAAFEAGEALVEVD